MSKNEKIIELMTKWLERMSLDDLADFYLDVMEERLQEWDEADIDYHLGEL